MQLFIPHSAKQGSLLQFAGEIKKRKEKKTVQNAGDRVQVHILVLQVWVGDCISNSPTRGWNPLVPALTKHPLLSGSHLELKQTGLLPGSAQRFTQPVPGNRLGGS